MALFDTNSGFGNLFSGMNIFGARQPEYLGGLLTTDTEEKRELLKTVVKAVEAEVRLTIYNEICDWKPLENRTAIIKMAGSLDNALLGVQAICADIALGKSNERATSE